MGFLFVFVRIICWVASYKLNWLINSMNCRWWKNKSHIKSKPWTLNYWKWRGNWSNMGFQYWRPVHLLVQVSSELCLCSISPVVNCYPNKKKEFFICCVYKYSVPIFYWYGLKMCTVRWFIIFVKWLDREKWNTTTLPRKTKLGPNGKVVM